MRVAVVGSGPAGFYAAGALPPADPPLEGGRIQRLPAARGPVRLGAEPAPADGSDASIEAIASSSLKEIVIVGRRGPAQAAFTTPELHEMGELAGADVFVDPADLEGAQPKDTNAERNLAVLHEFAA